MKGLFFAAAFCLVAWPSTGVLAGGIAQRMLDPKGYRKRDDHEDRDYAHGTVAGCFVCHTEEERIAYVEWLCKRTEALLKDQRVWVQVEAVAEELLKTRRLTSRQIRRVAREALRGRGTYKWGYRSGYPGPDLSLTQTLRRF